MPPGYLLLGYDERGACPVLVDDHCSIYDDRPLVCRTYDCRIYAATASRRTRRDRPAGTALALRLRDGADGELHEAVLAAVRFIREHPACLPSRAAYEQPIRVATLGVAAHEAFCEGARAATRSRASVEQRRFFAIANANEELFGDG